MYWEKSGIFSKEQSKRRSVKPGPEVLNRVALSLVSKIDQSIN